MLHRLKLTMFTVLFLGVFLLNTTFFHNPAVGVVLLSLYLGVYGWELGGVFASKERAVLRWWKGAWILLSLILIFLALSYYIWQIHPIAVQVLVLLTPALVLWLQRKHASPSLFQHAHDLWHAKRHHPPSTVWIAATLFILITTVFFISLAGHPVTDAVRSVWERLPEGVLLLFPLAIALLFALLWRGRERALSLALTCVMVFTFVSVVAVVFPLGYGFDSFIHKATELYLAEYGTITPKPFYYIGQYALVLFAHHGFSLSIDVADTFLVPVLCALFLPMAWYFAAAHIAKKRSVAMATVTGLFLIPLSQFIVTTPQALANLWTLLLILASVPHLLEREKGGYVTLGIGAFATLFIHPIAGIPAALYFVLLLTDPSERQARFPLVQRGVRILLTLFACIVLPLSFVLNGFVSGQTLGLNWSALHPAALLSSFNLQVFFENRFAPLLDFVYLYGMNATGMVLLLAFFGWFEYRHDLSTRFRSLIIMAVALAVNFFILSTLLEFSFLIDYERSNYATRLIPLISFFLAPYVILALSHVFINLKERPPILRMSVFVLLVAFVGSSFYLAYPRRDAYQTNRGFNVGQSDIDTVHLIEQLAGNEPYLVLANQSVSAAAIQELGFRYYGDLFFYPIPTGGSLYQYFLKMNERPSRETAKEAMELVPMHGDVTTVFYVVNNYWWEAPRLIETAKNTADDWRSVGPYGQVHLFKYNLSDDAFDDVAEPSLE